MRIPCPFCGDRNLTEFTYLGDAAFRRPDPDAPGAPALYFEAVYLRDNPSGAHNEWWYHGAGCRLWLRVTRNTRTHEVLAAVLAKDAVSA
jgi:heterotetrameric sarcosine oxidase delta subunit